MSRPCAAPFLRHGHLTAALMAWVLCLTGLQAATIDELARGFLRPPDSAKPQLWWHWMNGNISRDGIVKDLQAIRDAGFGGVILFEESDRIPEGPVRYLSEQHLDLIAFASAECARLGLEFGFQNCPGWSSSGGPWITPDQAMKHLTWSEQVITGGRHVSSSLPHPSTRVRPLEEVGPPGRYEEGHDYYRDVTVLAFPTPAEPGWRLDQWQEKAGFRSARNLREQGGPAPAGAVIDPATIVDLTEHLRPDGRLDWDAPPGKWTLLRFGYTLTAHANRESPTTGARGLESDKLSREATEFHWRHFVDRILAAATRSSGSRVSTVMIDSYEPLTQTWTRRMPEEFRRLRAYDLTRFLPCLTGRVVGDVRNSERFLWDYRRTLADLVAENYYGVFAEQCRQRGLKLALEGYGYYGTFFDEFANNLRADIPMGEFWAGVVKWHHWSGKLAASAADISGHHVVGAEAFTAGNDQAAWKWHPFTLKAQGDYFLCRGVNRFYFQAGVHQPWADHIRPGMTLGPHGIQMNRNNTWFSQSRVWLTYQARSQFMLQHGRLVADLYVDYGDNAPATLRPAPRVTAQGPKGVNWDVEADVAPDIGFVLPAGRDFHAGHSRVILDLRVNERGQLVLPNGQTYAVLVLSHDDRMEAPVLEHLARLVDGGATVVGPRPNRSPSLQDTREQDAGIATIAARLWGDNDGRNPVVRTVGRGRIFQGVELDEVFRRIGLPPDFEYRPVASFAGSRLPRVDYIHRRVADGEFYFLSNQRNEPAAVECVLRVAKGVPELWQPESGEIRPLPLWQRLSDGRTAVRLNLEPAESCFVVFRDRADASAPTGLHTFVRDGHPVTDDAVADLQWLAGSWHADAFAPGRYETGDASGTVRSATVPSLPPARDVSTDWDVTFPAGTGAPARLALPWLAPLSAHEVSGVKYFSGTATYSKILDIPAEALATGRLVALDLGDVQVIAELSVNGQDAGILWKPPFRRNITDLLRPGANTVTIKVTNLWRNRLVGDAIARNFTADDAARLADRMLSGDTSAQATPTSTGGADGTYPVPDWVRRGASNPEPGTYSFTVFPFVNTSTPLPPSGLVGPVRVIFGQRVPLRQAAPGG